MRIQKFLSSCGTASRRKAEKLVLAGEITINGKIAQPGDKVNPQDLVKYKNSVVRPQSHVYIMINKPVGYITSTKDQFNRKVVTDLINIKEKIYPIGRLDYNTSGLLLLTTDGDLAYKLTHPKHQIEKTYLVKVKGLVSEKNIQKLKSGVDIGGYITQKAEVGVRKQNQNTLLQISVKEGKNRQIRKMIESVNHRVLELKRISIGEIKLEGKPGEWRHLTSGELRRLKEIK